MSLETRAEAAAARLRAATPVDVESGLTWLRRTHRRRRTTRAAAAGVAVAATVLASAALVGVLDAAEPVPAGPPPSTSLSPASPSDVPNGSGPVVIPQDRPQPVVVEPRTTSTITPGETLLTASSTGDPAYDGDGSIELSVGDGRRRQLRVEAFCADAPEAWYVMTIEPNATYIDTGRCDEADIRVGGFDYNSEYTGKTLRIFVTGEDPRAFRQCFEYSPPEGCDDLERPLRGSGATMRLTTYEWQGGPTAVRMFGQPFPARANTSGRTWSLTHAAAAATGGTSLSFDVDSSSHRRIAQVVFLDRDRYCDERDGCTPTVELLIDGQVEDDPSEYGPFSYRGSWEELAAGRDHDIAVRLVGGDPTAFDVGVLIYEAD